MREKPALIFLSLAKAFGGGEHFLVELIPSLQKRGYQCSIITPPCAEILNYRHLLVDVEFIEIDLSFKERNLLSIISSVMSLLWPVRKRPGAAIYSNGFVGVKFLALLGLFFSSPTICHLHESEYGYYSSLRSRIFCSTVDRFIAISRAVRDEFHNRSGVPLSCISVVYNGIRSSQEEPKDDSWIQSQKRALGIPPDDLLVGMAARTDRLKGHEILLRAWRQVLNQISPTRAHLIIWGFEQSTGNASLFQLLNSLIHELNLPDTTLRGPAPIEDVRRFMRTADIWVVPSTSEGFGRTAVEAMAERTALIVSDVGGLSEIVEDGVSGRKCPPGDTAALADSLMSLLRDSSLRKRLATGGYARFKSLFSLERMVQQIAALLEAQQTRRSD